MSSHEDPYELSEFVPMTYVDNRKLVEAVLMEREKDKITDFDVLVTRNGETGVETYFFIKKGHKVIVTGNPHPVGGGVSTLRLMESSQHIVGMHDGHFKVIKSRADKNGATALRLTAEYIESCGT